MTNSHRFYILWPIMDFLAILFMFLICFHIVSTILILFLIFKHGY